MLEFIYLFEKQDHHNIVELQNYSFTENCEGLTLTVWRKVDSFWVPKKLPYYMNRVLFYYWDKPLDEISNLLTDIPQEIWWNLHESLIKPESWTTWYPYDDFIERYSLTEEDLSWAKLKYG